jgi:hypothetical protein
MLDPVTAWSSWSYNLRASYSRDHLEHSARVGLETLISDLAQEAMGDGYSDVAVLKDPDFCLHLVALDCLTRHMDRQVIGIVRDPLDAVASFATVAARNDSSMTLLKAGGQLWSHFAGIADLFDGTVFSDAKLLRLEDLHVDPDRIQGILKIKKPLSQRDKSLFELLSRDDFASKKNFQPFARPTVASEYSSYNNSDFEELTSMYSGLRYRLGYA